MQQIRWEYRTVKLDEEGWFERAIDSAELDRKPDQIGAEGREVVNAICVKDRDGRQTR